jgi:peptidoglycan hydrolase CwlO-like protein
MALLAQVREAGAKRDALAAELEKHRALLGTSGAEVKDLKQEQERQSAAMAQLKARLAEQEAVIARLKREMDQLKRIDLSPQR